jgi:hypothetical protein
MWFPWHARSWGAPLQEMLGGGGGGGGGGAGGGGSARPDLTLFTTFSPVFFFSRVIKSGVSVGGARVGRGARRGVSRCEARTSGGLYARFLPSPPSQLMIGMPLS